MIDIDHFKTVNDVHGHNVGDIVLKQLVGIVSNGTRDEDLVGRLGGEEFALILPETDLERAKILANRLREAVKRQSFSGDSGAFGISISVGISMPNPSDLDILPALERADKALYDAKRNGRNRVETMAPPTPAEAIETTDDWIVREAS
jgi:diguanylate cyclase (GGDEF)-like protein